MMTALPSLFRRSSLCSSLCSLWLAAALLSASIAAPLMAQEPASPPSSDPYPFEVADSRAFLPPPLAQGAEAVETDPAIERRVAGLLDRMSLREKVGQMTLLDIAMVTEGEDQEIRIDPKKLRRAVGEYGVGGILNVNGQALPPERWRELLGEIQAAATRTRLGLPVIYGIDSLHGAGYVAGAALFPQPLGMAATWNPALMEEVARTTAAETRAAGLPWNLVPVLDLGRQPLWPRFYETFGEDPHLASVMGAASVRGFQGGPAGAEALASPRHVAACLKHYVGAAVPTTGHDRTPARIPEIELRQLHLPPFAAAIRAGARTVMVNSGELNGIPGHVDRRLLVDILRGELGFRGVAVSDWEDIKKLVTVHRVAADEKEATRRAVLAGVDMSMVPRDLSFPDLLRELVEEGAVPMARIDEAVGRILTLKLELGLFDDPLLGITSGVEVGSREAWALSLAAARESVTLLANRPVPGGGGRLTLPLAASGAGPRILVTGPTADSLTSLGGGWSLTWQGGTEELYETLFPSPLPTLRDALAARFGEDRVVYAPGARHDEEVSLAQAVAAARDADVVVLALGEPAYAEGMGDVDDLALPEAQVQLARAVATMGKPLVVVLLEGRPRLLGPVADLASAVVLGYQPGPAGGQALAEVLAGDIDPGGRLPFTYPRSPNALRTYDHRTAERRDASLGMEAFRPQFEFGSGLSYTRFETAGLTVTPEVQTKRALEAGEEIQVEVAVRNVGSRPGTEVVQLYLTDEIAGVPPPVRRLIRFAKIRLDPGQTRRLTFHLSAEDLSFIGTDHRPVLEAGAFTLRVGPGVEAWEAGFRVE